MNTVCQTSLARTVREAAWGKHRLFCETLDVAGVKSPVLASPAVERLLSDAVLAAQVRDGLLALLCFPQHADHLFLRKPLLLHVEPPALAEILLLRPSKSKPG